MKRSIAAVAGGFALWTVLWCTANAAAPLVSPGSIRPDGTVGSTAVLVFFLAWTVLISALAGALARRIAGSKSACALAAVFLCVGTAVEVAWWNSAPAWYHLTFLALLVPATVLGGRGRDRAAAVAVG